MQDKREGLLQCLKNNEIILVAVTSGYENNLPPLVDNSYSLVGDIHHKIDYVDSGLVKRDQCCLIVKTS